MRRREFFKIIGGGVAAWPLVARAQRPEFPVIGFLSSSSPDGFAIRVRAFWQGLSSIAGRRTKISEFRRWPLSWSSVRWM